MKLFHIVVPKGLKKSHGTHWTLYIYKKKIDTVQSEREPALTFQNMNEFDNAARRDG